MVVGEIVKVINGEYFLVDFISLFLRLELLSYIGCVYVDFYFILENSLYLMLVEFCVFFFKI